jgi:peptidylprolyl isomerase
VQILDGEFPVMKRVTLLFLAVAVSAAGAQTASKTTATTSPAKATSTTAAAKPSTTAATVPPWIKLPPGVPHVAHGPLQTPFSLHYEDIKVGTGAEGEPNKLWHIKYTGWRATDGVKFDSWDDHKQPEMKDGKPVMGDDGKPKMKDPEPMQFPQGVGRVIPGFDYGLSGMKIGGRRRIFIPWQMAYGTRSIPDRPDHPGIPPKSDLIFDVELVDVTDMPAPPARPGMPPRPAPVAPHPGAGSQPNAAPGAPAAPGSSAAPAGSSAAPQPAAPAQPATPPPASAPAQPSTAPQPQAPASPQK